MDDIMKTDVDDEQIGPYMTEINRQFEYIDKEDDNAVRHIRICPLYAINNLFPSLP